MTFVIVVCCASAVGFLAGLLTFRRSGRWCPACGETLRCRVDHGAVTPPVWRP